MLHKFNHKQIPIGLRFLILNTMYQQHPGKSSYFYNKKLTEDRLPFNKNDTVEGFIWWDDMEEQLKTPNSNYSMYYKYYPYTLKSNRAHISVVYSIINQSLEHNRRKAFPTMIKKTDNRGNFLIIEASNNKKGFLRTLGPIPNTLCLRTSSKIEVEIFNRIKNNGGRK